MPQRYTEQEFILAKPSDLLPFSCTNCDKLFTVDKNRINYSIKKNKSYGKFCSTLCANIYKHNQNTKIVTCEICGKNITKLNNQLSKYKNHFCSRSCATTYKNFNKIVGTRRSKLEIYLETKLIELYPTLEIHFNRKDTINSELDIYIPSLKLAFELNGIFHYEPIFGDIKLNQTQNNDNRKFQACLERGIELCIIDTTGQTYFKEHTSIKYLNIITKIIDLNL